jgi:SnoaL-like domain
MESAKARRVMDELEILRLLATLAQAVDDQDEARYRACFADEVMGPAPSGDPNTWLAVSSQAYAHRSIEAVSAMTWTHHKLCNPVVDLMGDRAAAKVDVVVDMEASGSKGRLEHLTIGGRYELEFARLDQGWRISKRRLVRRYVTGDPMLADQARIPRSAGA